MKECFLKIEYIQFYHQKSRIRLNIFLWTFFIDVYFSCCFSYFSYSPPSSISLYLLSSIVYLSLSSLLCHLSLSYESREPPRPNKPSVLSPARSPCQSLSHSVGRTWQYSSPAFCLGTRVALRHVAARSNKHMSLLIHITSLSPTFDCYFSLYLSLSLSLSLHWIKRGYSWRMSSRGNPWRFGSFRCLLNSQKKYFPVLLWQLHTFKGALGDVFFSSLIIVPELQCLFRAQNHCHTWN